MYWKCIRRWSGLIFCCVGSFWNQQWRLYQKAAALMRSLSQNHAFMDGNKRIAWYAGRLFLQANGIKVRVTPEEAVDLFEAIATHRMDVDETAAFLEAHAAT